MLRLTRNWLARSRSVDSLRCLRQCARQTRDLCTNDADTIDGNELIPETVVAKLDTYIVGQHDAKRAVAIALRNRWRRRHITDGSLRTEVSPMNILMSGPTGTGKTEIARRLAKLTDSPFLKVEATKFTEVGIYGANADSMIKDLVDVAVDMEREKARKYHAAAARDRAIDRLIDHLKSADPNLGNSPSLRDDILSGKLNAHLVDMQFRKLSRRSKTHPTNSMDGLPLELEQMIKSVSSMIQSRSSSESNKKPERLHLSDALSRLEMEETDDKISEDEIIRDAIDNVQNNGIIFLDEVDKLAEANNGSSFGQGSGQYRKGEGVQKELLALTEGCVVNTRYGLVHTDHILFIGSGAFHKCNPSDLMPELQGRLPIRVTLSPLGVNEFERILKETEYNLLQQTRALLETEGLKVIFTDDAIQEIASISVQVNSQTDDIGARRLATIVSKVTEEVSFHAPKMKGVTHTIDRKYVQQQLRNVLQKTDLSKYIL